MSLHGATRHFQLGGNFGVVTPLQKQIDNLLFARPQPYGLLLHPDLQVSAFSIHFTIQPGAGLDSTKTHSIHNAILRRECSVTPEQPFPQPLARPTTGLGIRRQVKCRVVE